MLHNPYTRTYVKMGPVTQFCNPAATGRQRTGDGLEWSRPNNPATGRQRTGDGLEWSRPNHPAAKIDLVYF